MYIKKLPSIYLLITLVILPQISETIYSPALTHIALYFHSSIKLVEWTFTTFFLGFSLGVSIWGHVSDRMGRRPALLAGLIIYMISSLLCAHATTIGALLALRFFQAFGVSVGSVMTLVIIRDSFDHKKQAKIFALTGMLIGLSPAIGPTIGGYLTQYSQWQSNFLFLTLLGSVCITYAYYRLPETRFYQDQTANIHPHSYIYIFKILIKDPHIIASAVLIGAYNGILFSFYAHAPFIFIDVLKFTPVAYGHLVIFLAAGVTIGSLISLLYKKKNRYQLIVIGCLTNFLIMLVFLFFSFYNNYIDQNPQLIIYTIIVTMMCFYVTFGLVIPNVLSLALIQYKKILGSASSILGMLYYLIVTLILFGIGLIAHKLILAMSVYFTILSLIMLSLCLTLFKTKQPADQLI